MKIEKRKIDEVIPYARNPRANDAAVDAVAASINKFGFRQPIVVDEQGVIVVGHTRFKAARRLGLDEVPVHVAEGLTEAQVKAYRLADNRTADYAHWDEELLPLELADLSELEYDLAATGFTQEELARLLEAGPNDGLTDPNDIPEPPEDPTTQVGDLYVLGNHRLLCGDSTAAGDVERLMDGVKAAMVLADPPYNVNYRGGSSTKTRVRSDAYHDQFADYGGWLTKVLTVASAVSDHTAPLHLWHSSSELRAVLHALDEARWTNRSMIVWNKGSIKGGLGQTSKQYRTQFEPMFYCHKKGRAPRWYGPGNESEMWDVKGPSANPLHPTMKPVAIYERSLSNHTRSGDIVLECFLGSGTTLIAAEQLRRKCYGIEIEPRYCDVIVERWEKFTGQRAERETPQGVECPVA